MQSVVPEIHLSGADLDVPLDQGDRGGGREPVRRGGLAQFWRRLCADAARLAPKPRSAQGLGHRQVWRAVLSHVGVLSPELRRRVRGTQLSELADRPRQARHPGGIPPAAADGSLSHPRLRRNWPAATRYPCDMANGSEIVCLKLSAYRSRPEVNWPTVGTAQMIQNGHRP